MISQVQKIVDETSGDCYGACIASIFELSVWPNYHSDEHDHMRSKWNTWLAKRGLEVIYYQFGAYPSPQGYAILTVASASFPGALHAVVYDGVVGEIVWNPNPQDTRGVDIPPNDWKGFDVFVVRNPVSMGPPV